MLFKSNLLLPVLVSSAAAAPSSHKHTAAVNTTTCNGETYVYEELAGYGFLPPNDRDKYGDTLGGLGSSLAVDKSSWKKVGQNYQGVAYALPDRGWNTNGTINFQNRIQKISITLNVEEPTLKRPCGPNLDMKYLDTILLADFEGTPTTGLDPDITGPYKHFSEVPFALPSANYTGNGFGGPGNGGNRVTLDPEGLFLGADGSFRVSDEYGPYIYQFDSKGKMINAIQPPNAILPRRHKKVSFSADSPPIYNPDLEPSPEENPTGRNNNQGFEGLTTNPEGTKLYVLLQSATNQDGGLETERNTRFLVYDISTPTPSYEAEYVVHLPLVDPSDEDSDVARQSEIHYISPTQFLILARDSDAGAGQDETESLYRHVDVIDISSATNVKGKEHDCSTCQIASREGVLRKDIEPAEYCSWLDFNVNSQLRRFGVHNGGAQNKGLLNEKWESMALLPAEGEDEYYLISFSDNDFINQDGYMNFGKFEYQDESGFDLLNQALVFKVKLPKGTEPLVG
ncbi:uncharacterized protein LTR77_003458 [Saxophila tyrrhenica]|uniref:Phytase-like domain-containing protein n=1 Tax=Saxophila tyrrhenica TaxID=1690608 RepID=A0AAV9PHP2_9PEZI|nr:hypothetical protein LTR77_003458 [Saxophila tyrrhenica]